MRHVLLQPAQQFMMSLANDKCPTLSNVIANYDLYLTQLGHAKKYHPRYAEGLQKAIDIAKKYHYGVPAHAVTLCECY